MRVASQNAFHGRQVGGKNRLKNQMKNYMLTIYHQGDVIEQRESKTPFPNFLVGEQIHIEFENSHYNDEHGMWWVVTKRAHLISSERTGLHALHLHCEPDPKRGDMFA